MTKKTSRARQHRRARQTAIKAEHQKRGQDPPLTEFTRDNDGTNRNNLYAVTVSHHGEKRGFGTCLRLFVTRHDGKRANNWDHLMEIKDEFLGPDHEAVEILPSRAREMDTEATQLWGFAKTPDMEKAYQFPWGYNSTSTTPGEEAEQ